MFKTLGQSHLSYEAFESVIMDIERNLNNRPLTYFEAEGEEDTAYAEHDSVGTRCVCSRRH